VDCTGREIGLLNIIPFSGTADKKGSAAYHLVTFGGRTIIAWNRDNSFFSAFG
jgi:hypothetical protein